MGGFRFGSRRAFVSAMLAALAIAPSCRSGPDRAPDVVVVTWDTVRADRVGTGAEAAGPSPTPRLDALAGEGTFFAEARSPVPITLPAHASLMTGLFPPAHRARDNGQFTVSASVPTLAERFRAGGHATGAFVSAAVLGRAFGLARGFEVYDDDLTEQSGNRSMTTRRSDHSVDAALAWLAAVPADRPVFLWVHLFAPHRPWRAPARFAERFDPYRAEIAFADAQTGRLLDALARAGRLSRAIVVVTSDHGEGLGDHGEGTHSYFAYDSTLRVPLVLWSGADAGTGWRRGARVTGPAALVDIAPTLLELAGLPELPADGRSLTQTLRTAQPVPPRVLPFESVVPALDYSTAPVFGLLDASGQTWFDGPQRERYEAHDPQQLENRYRVEDAAEADALFAAVDRDWPPQDAPLALDETTRRQLEALGYASDGVASAQPSDVDAKERIALFHFKSLGAERLSPEKTLERLDALRARHGPLLAIERFRSDTLRVLGRGLEAIAVIDAAALAHPHLDGLRKEVAQLRAERARKLELARAIRETLAREPDHSTAERDLALTLHQLEQWDEARLLYQRILTRRPEDDATRANLARGLAARGERARAVEILAAARSRSGHDVELDCLTGRILEHSPDREAEARAALAACAAGGGSMSARGRALLGDASNRRAGTQEPATLPPPHPAARAAPAAMPPPERGS